MMTLLEYTDRKMMLDQRMKQTRHDESRERKAIDDARIEQDRREFEEFLDRKHRRAAECKEQCDAVSDKYKDLRRAIWTEEAQLTMQWRAQMREEGGAL